MSQEYHQRWYTFLQSTFAGTSEEATVSLYNEEVGLWEYNLSGVGLKPGVMAPTRIAATLGADGSSFVSWRNPFVDPVKVLLSKLPMWLLHVYLHLGNM